MNKVKLGGSMEETPPQCTEIGGEMGTGSLYLRWGQQTGVLDFLSGNLIGASVDGVGGFEAAVELLSWSQGTYEFSSHSKLVAPKVRESVDILFLQAKRRRSSRRVDFDGIVFLQATVRIDDLAQVGAHMAYQTMSLLVDVSASRKPWIAA